MELDTARRQVREALAQALPETFASEDEEDGVLIGYVVVAEWAGIGGKRWLSASAGDVNDEEPAAWTTKGWLCHALDTIDDEDGDEE